MTLLNRFRKSVIYPAPRWFRDTVTDWLYSNATPIRERDREIDQLFTALVKAQPPALLIQARDDA